MVCLPHEKGGQWLMDRRPAPSLSTLHCALRTTPQLAKSLQAVVHAGQSCAQRTAEGGGHLAELLAFEHSCGDDGPLRIGKESKKFADAAGVVGLHDRV